jgi:predicted amidophosphoribosyltransferase
MAQRITKQRVDAARLAAPRRRRFSDHPIVKKSADGQYSVGTLFPCIDRMFEEETHIFTQSGRFGTFAFLNTQANIKAALEWQKERESLIFLRDTLGLSLAIDFNLESLGVYTKLGQAEHDAKTSQSAKAISILVDSAAETIKLLKPYADAPLICAVPPCPTKQWDLPSVVVAGVAARTGKHHVADVHFSKKKESVKSLKVEEKWDALEAAQLSVGSTVVGKRVILFDDKYQSGITLQFVASKLIDAGASDVYGLCAVKTWRDTDNT